jgi:hypothetical protein
METNNALGAVELVATEQKETAVRELSEFQLALVGGGIGETIL